MDLVSKHWPNGFSNNVFSIIINKSAARGQSIKASSAATRDGGDDDYDEEKVQQRVIQAIGKRNTSTLASHSKFKSFQAKEVMVLNGRPQEAVGLPIGLFHPVFDLFRERIDSPSFSPTTYQLSNTLPLLTASQYIYDQETGPNGWIEGLQPLLSDLLDLAFQNSGTTGTRSDGIFQGRNGAYHLIIEAKNEIGTGGSDPSVQGAIAYSNYWGIPEREWLRQRCCCPSMILAIAGPWMCILGGIMLNHPVVQPLTPFFFVGNNPYSSSHTHFVAKVFASLAQSLSELWTFYEPFKKSSDIPRNLERCSPHIQELTIGDQRVTIQYKAQIKPKKPIFRAVARPEDGENYKIVVKFAESYNAAAHRLLEKMELAPQLIFVSSEGPKAFKVADRIMVVMKEMPYRDLSDAQSFPDCVQKDVMRALDALHQQNLVFGDLRPPNILVMETEQGQETGGMLVDFDWCGMAGQATYPYDINPTIEWPEGVGPGLPLQKEHDTKMFRQLLSI
ncbi:unnamed protein product [Rhizoctonia solani]|uniref:Protein kinase domain-containing protein n=1 Tax=Rhizoctonia solani TaxID=456999 RepID=A0A8H3DVT6_9AGAM|nr:unnamed protein product [Rhizoctonia solani]